MDNVRPLVSAADVDRREAYTKAARDMELWQKCVNLAAEAVVRTNGHGTLNLGVALRELQAARARLSTLRAPETEEELRASLLLVAIRQHDAALLGLLDAQDDLFSTLAEGKSLESTLDALDAARDEYHKREARLKVALESVEGEFKHG